MKSTEGGDCLGDMLFFPEIDKPKTIKLARRILRDYPRWRQVANDIGGQKLTQELTFMPRGGGHGPSRPVERLAVNKVDAAAKVEAVEKAISNILNEEHRFILIYNFIKIPTWTNREIGEHLGYEKTQFQEEKNLALLAFAETYLNGEILVLKSE